MDRYLVLGLIVMFLMALKWSYNPGLGQQYPDGAHYFQIARNISESNGFTTTVSLYHQGFKVLPHPATVYPIWPLLLGTIAKAAPLPVLAFVLPEIFYFASLCLLYFVGNLVFLEISGQSVIRPGSTGRVLDSGHVAVVLFGSNPVYFSFSSVPYTEPLAFTLLFATLLVFRAAVRLPGPGLPLLAGCAAALCYLTRYQMIVVPLAMLLTLLGLAHHSRAYYRVFVLSGLAMLVTIAPWVLYLAGFMDPFAPRALLWFGAYRETAGLAGDTSGIAAFSPARWAAELFDGLRVAFAPTHPWSYIASFGLAALLVPTAALHVVAMPATLKRALDCCMKPEYALSVMALLCGVLMVAPLQFMHSDYLWPWRFHHRQGLPFLLVLLPAYCYFRALGSTKFRVLALWLAGASIISGTFTCASFLTSPIQPMHSTAEKQLVEWLEAHGSRTAFVTTRAQALSVYTTAGLHWTHCAQAATTTTALLTGTSARFVIAYPSEDGCAFLPDAALLQQVASFGDRDAAIRVYRWLGPRP